MTQGPTSLFSMCIDESRARSGGFHAEGCERAHAASSHRRTGGSRLGFRAVTVAALLCASVGVRVAAQEQTMFCQRLRFKHAVGGTCSQDDGEAMEFEFGRCGKNREEVMLTRSLAMQRGEDAPRHGYLSAGQSHLLGAVRCSQSRRMVNLMAERDFMDR